MSSFLAPDLQVLREVRGRLAHLDHLALPDQQGQLDLPVLPAHRDHLVALDQVVAQEHLDQVVAQEHLDQVVSQDQVVLPDLPAQRDLDLGSLTRSCIL